jgi:hypothetical protein
MNSFDMYTALQKQGQEVAELAAWAENDGQHELASGMLERLERISEARIALAGRIMSNPKALAKLHACAASQVSR